MTYVVCMLPAIVVNMLFGSYIDYIGRKAFFIIPSLGFLIRVFVTWAVCSWDLDLNLLYIGMFIEGITGSLGTLFMAVFVYTADNTNKKSSRSFVMVAVQAILALFVSSTHIGIGYFITKEGYKWPLLAACVLIGLGTLGFIIFLEESIKRSSQTACFNPFEGAKRLYSFYLIKSRDPQHKRKDYIFLAVIFFLYGSCFSVSIKTLYLMNEPFCWSSEKLGYVGTITGVIQGFGPLIIMKIAQRYVGDDVIAVIALFTTAGSQILMSVADNDWMIYLGLMLLTCESCVSAIIRAILSRMVSLEHRGSLFSSLAMVELLTFAVSSIGLSNVYSATVSLWRGFTYLLIGLLIIFSAVLMIVYAVIVRRRISRLQYQINVQADVNGDYSQVVEDDEKPLLF